MEMLAYIGLGSNLDKPVQQVESGVQSLMSLPDSMLLAKSPLYQSPALVSEDDGAKQPDYINAVVALKTSLAPQALLELLFIIEKQHNRQRTQKKWMPRTLDLDLLLYGSQIIREPNLVVPHPEMCKRAFVLYPLFDIAPELVIPGKGALAALLKQSKANELKKISDSVYE